MLEIFSPAQPVGVGGEGVGTNQVFVGGDAALDHGVVAAAFCAESGSEVFGEFVTIFLVASYDKLVAGFFVAGEDSTVAGIGFG